MLSAAAFDQSPCEITPPHLVRKDSFSLCKVLPHTLSQGWKSVCTNVLKQRSIEPVAQAITSGEVQKDLLWLRAA